jgi:predicted metal-dependent hydrolase
MLPLSPLPDPPNIKMLPRYAKEETFPVYRFVPGLHPHPIRDPKGHSHRAIRMRVHPPWRPDEWPTLEAYLHGVDLFNRFYFWEAHEVWEGLWKSHPPQADPALFIQGLINLAASFLKLHMGSLPSSQKLWQAAEERLRRFQGAPWMGLAIDPLLAEIHDYLNPGKEAEPPKIGAATPSIRLAFLRGE